MNFASTYNLAAANSRLAEFRKQAAEDRMVRLAKKERRRNGA